MKSRKPDSPDYQSRETCQKCGSAEGVITTHHDYVYRCVGDDGRQDVKYIRFYLRCIPCNKKFKRDFAIGTIAFLQEIEYERYKLEEEKRAKKSNERSSSTDPDNQSGEGIEGW